MNSRDTLLGRVRDALRNSPPAPRPGTHGRGHEGAGSVSIEHEAPPAAQAAVIGPGAWLPAVGAGLEEQIALFAAKAAELKADFFPLEDEAELPARLQELASREGWTRPATHRGALTDLAVRALGPTLPILHTDEGYAVEALETCDVGITECEALIAQTGSVLVSSRASGGRALSVLPPHHVVVARAGTQLLPDLPAAFALLKGKYAGTDYPSFVGFVTGPSRTGDIERILVLGAHGPKKLTIFTLP